MSRANTRTPNPTRDRRRTPAISDNTAIAAGFVHSCGITTGGTAQCWGYNDDGRADVPAGVRFTAIAAGYGHSCGIRAGGTAQCWGDNGSGQSERARGGAVHCHRSRRRPFVRDLSRRQPPNAGATTTTASWTCPRGCGSLPSQQTTGIRAGSQPAAPPNAGATTTTASRMCPRGCGSLPSQQATGIRAGSEPAATAQCWGRNDDGESDAPAGRFTAISAGFVHSCGIRAGGHRPMLGRQRLRRVGRSCGGAVHRHHSRLCPFVRDHNRRHRPMLGPQRRRRVGRARRGAVRPSLFVASSPASRLLPLVQGVGAMPRVWDSSAPSAKTPSTAPSATSTSTRISPDRLAIGLDPPSCIGLAGRRLWQRAKGFVWLTIPAGRF